MKNINPLIFTLLLSLFLTFSVWSTVAFIQHGKAYQREMARYAEALNFKNRLLNIDEWLPGKKAYRAALHKAEEHHESSVRNYDLALQGAYQLVVGAVLFLALVALLFSWRGEFARYFAQAMLAVAIVCLVNGLFFPMLEIGAFKANLEIPVKTEIPYVGIEIDLSRTFDGRMYFYYQNKSVSDLVQMLLQSGNGIIAVCITLFSVVVPLFKVSLSLLMLISRPLRNRKWLVKTVSWIGKWSMADVFVVAVFLAFLSFYNLNTGIDTESSTLPGLYFFLSYCLLSMLSFPLIERAIKAEKQGEKVKQDA